MSSDHEQLNWRYFFLKISKSSIYYCWKFSEYHEKHQFYCSWCKECNKPRMIYGQPAEFKEAESAIKKIEDETDFTCGQMLLGKEAWPVLSSKIRFVNGLLAVLAVFLDSRTGYSSS